MRTLRGTTTTSLSGNTSGYTEEDTRYRREFRDYNFVAKPSETATERYGAKPATAICRYLSICNDWLSVGNPVVDDLGDRSPKWRHSYHLRGGDSTIPTIYLQNVGYVCAY